MVQRTLATARVAALFSVARPAYYATLANAGLLLLVLWETFPVALLVAWFAVLLAITLLRIGLHRSYAHRVAISNHRLIDFVDGKVSFRWKDYRHDSAQKVMRLEAQEFIRRLLLHVLPNGLQRIRHYGLLANRHRALKLARCRQLLAQPTPAVKRPEASLDYRDRYEQLTGKSLRECPKCAHGRMVCIETLLPRAMPRAPPRDRS